MFEEIVVENVPNMGKETDIQVQEAQIVLIKMNPERHTPRHIIIKMVKVKDKERILKAAREKQLGKPHKAISLFHQKVYESEGSDMIYSKC